MFGETVTDGLADGVEVDATAEEVLEYVVVPAEVDLDVDTDTLVLLELDVGAGEDADGELLDGDGVASGAGGGMTLKLTVAPHCERERPFGQHPPFVQ